MNKLILTILCVIFMQLNAAAQIVYGIRWDSTMIRFTNGPMPDFVPDTATVPLWEIGYSHKSFFGITSTGPMAMMTDTIHNYPVKANNWFIIKVVNNLNVIVNFWHKYQTDSSHAGGIVEFSLDHGATWENVKGSCNIDGSGWGPGIYTSNFYTATDTLRTGEPSFTGTKNSLQYSQFQFFEALPIGPTGSGCSLTTDTFYVRFRFVSDTSTDTLAGWIIDSVQIEQDVYPGVVSKINKSQPLHIFPNPSYDGTFNFPALNNEQKYSMEVYNAMGQRILKMPYKQSIDLSLYAKGLYFYKVSDGTEYYSGRLLVE